MKKMLIFAMTLAFMANMTLAVFAAEAKPRHVIRGTIVSIDAAKNELVVKVAATGEEKTIVATHKMLSSLKVNDNVKVKLKKDTNQAKSIRIINLIKEESKENKEKT
jgi:hypothetical protein